MGRAKQPLKLYARDPKNPWAPQAVPAAPPMPTHLAPDEKAAYKRFAATALKMRVVTEDDWCALEHLAIIYAEAQRLRKVIRQEGSTYETRAQNGSLFIRPRPEAAMLRALGTELISLYARFGFSPADRLGVSAAPNPVTNADDEFA